MLTCFGHLDVSAPCLLGNQAHTSAWQQPAQLGGLALLIILMLLGMTGHAYLRQQKKTQDKTMQARTGNKPTLWQQLKSENGTATVEFLLVIPILMFILLLMLQITFVMTGRIYVQYAANAAARVATVQIPAFYSEEEPRNVIDVSSSAGKFERIRTSAAMALIPVSGQLNANNDGNQIATGLTQFFTNMQAAQPSWVDSLAAGRTALCR